EAQVDRAQVGASRDFETPPVKGRGTQALDRDQPWRQSLSQLATIDLDPDQLPQLLLALLRLRQRSLAIHGYDQRVGREVIQQRRLRWIEIGLETLDAVEVGARSNPLDVRQPLVAYFGQRVAEVELMQPGVGRGDRFGGQDQLRRRKDPRRRDAPDRALRFDLELAK